MARQITREVSGFGFRDGTRQTPDEDLLPGHLTGVLFLRRAFESPGKSIVGTGDGRTSEGSPLPHLAGLRILARIIARELVMNKAKDEVASSVSQSTAITEGEVPK